METISRLRVLLMRAFAGEGGEEVMDELMAHKTCLLNLFEVGGRSATEQKELEGGKTTLPSGHTLSVNADFTRQALFVSQQLEVSERYIAGILHALTVSSPHLHTQPVQCVEGAIDEYHLRRRHLADSLVYLLQATEAVARGETEGNLIFQRAAEFVYFDLFSTEGGLAPKIIKELQNLGVLVAKAEAAKRNARTGTIPPTGQTGVVPALGATVFQGHSESLQYERRQLGATLPLLARLGLLSSADVEAIVQWLVGNPNQPLTFYLLTAVFNALDPVDPEYEPDTKRAGLATQMVAWMTRKLSPTNQEWKDAGLKSAVLLKWTLFLTDARHRNPDLETKAGFKTEELETQIWNAIQGDALTYLLMALAQLYRSSPLLPSIVRSLPPLNTEQSEWRELPAPEFLQRVYDAFEVLLRSLILHASSELRKIKQRQEDIVLASRGQQPQQAPARSDIAVLYSFIGLLYTALPAERALQFWGSTPHTSTPTYMELVESSTGRLPAFLQWAVWSAQPHYMALYDMLAGLANGTQCAELAHNFMARGSGEVIPGSSVGGGQSVSWGMVFGILDSWAQPGTRPPPSHQQAHQFQQSVPSVPAQIAPHDVLLAQSFLRLLAAVASHSVAVRKAIAGHAGFRAIPTLLSLIPQGVPLELKGAIFDTVAAFCRPAPGAGAVGAEICRSVWILMERLEVINVRGGGPGKGVEVELDEVEAVHRVYPATIPFLRLLATLIHTPKRIPLRERTLDVAYASVSGSKAPFVAFVVDNVFGNIPRREYAVPADRWEINDLCLTFVERCLASFDVESLTLNSTAENVLALLMHPGHDLLARLLTPNTAFHKSIMSYVLEGLPGFDRAFDEEEPFFASTIVRVVRIVLRVLEAQDVFLDVLVPLIQQLDPSTLSGHAVHPRSHYTRLDTAIGYTDNVAPALAAYVTTFHSHVELALLSVKTLAILAKPLGGGVIERSDESDRIMAGYTAILDNTESVEDPLEAESTADKYTGAGAEDPSLAHEAALQQATRLAVLQLFVRNTDSRASYPNLAHFLLFGSPNNKEGIQDPHALGSSRTCIHSLLDLVNEGVPRLNAANGDERDDGDGISGPPLFQSLPSLAEPMYHVLYQLCVHPRTSEFVMRYLRTREGFFARQVAGVPCLVPSIGDEDEDNEDDDESGTIQVMYTDGSRVLTTVPQLTSFLRLRSWIFDLVSTEMHVLSGKTRWKGVDDVLGVLFGVQSSSAVFADLAQTSLRLIEFGLSLSFDWADSLSVQPLELRYLVSLPLNTCVRLDADGCEIVDRSALLLLLAAARRQLTQNQIQTEKQLAELHAEITYILESCAVENHRRQVAHARAASYDAWKRLLDVVLLKCFDRVPADRREPILLEVLGTLLKQIATVDDDQSGILLSEAVVTCVTRLRDERRVQVLHGRRGMPVDRLAAILKTILECVADNVELVRGNLYAAAGLVVGDGELVSLGDSLSHVDRLVSTIARDAIDGSEIWQTVAFMLLDSLLRLTSHTPILTPLSKYGILSNFVRGLRDSDSRLGDILKPDPDDLNALYVYEAKMSLFIRVAMARAGAERLVEAGVVSVLAGCDYVDKRPDGDVSFVDASTFLPSATHRYHQLLLPALQLVCAIVATLGTKHSTASSQAREFLAGHSASVVILLKSDDSELDGLAVVEEMRLLVWLCAGLLPGVPKSELLSPHSGFGAIHGAILSLAAKCLGGRSLLAGVTPQTDAELLVVSQSPSKFDALKRQKERVLRRSIVEYLGSASEFTEAEIVPVLSPVVVVPRGENQTRFIATLPTIGDAISALSSLATDLAATLRQIAALSAELSAPDHVRIDHDIPGSSGLDIPQKRALVCRALETERKSRETDLAVLSGTVEMMLLMLWRHIALFVSPSPSSSQLAPPPDPESFKADVGARLGPVLAGLQALELGKDGKLYVDIMARRLRDCTGLGGEDHESMQM